ncbi:MAG TPA: peptide ABC transporter substrate-binding protein [Pyrinomonadaceae bacterium]|nr:peptide ABC transporter substrate-binding protein [Pyrinomonadaceae bacterium]
MLGNNDTTSGRDANPRKRGFRFLVVPILGFVALFAACGDIQRPKVEPFFAGTGPPAKQELRWSNGGMPKSLDPARAAAAPETDIVKAIYEGLTDLDSANLTELPGVAEKWESSEDLRTWTFHLRKDARWSNGERITAADFVRSWRRLQELSEINPASTHLVQNIVGMQKRSADVVPEVPADFLNEVPSETKFPDPPANDSPTTTAEPDTLATPEPPLSGPLPPSALKERGNGATEFGVVAVDEVTLSVKLQQSDKDFPRLVSNPLFRPVHRGSLRSGRPALDPEIVTNGAFRVVGIDENGVSLERSEKYWNRQAVSLERVRFIATQSAEAALEAYKKGEVDVVTNAAFQPLGLKLLAPYADFRRTTHGALNFYEYNLSRPPFDDRRVREALAIAIDREKLADGDLQGTTEPATKFLPFGKAVQPAVTFDAAKAKRLLETAGFPDGEGFPTVRLVVNRNNTQNRVARSVARMWKQNLNIDTDIVVAETSDIESVRASGDFDLVRRGVVLAAHDELVNILSIFGTVDARSGDMTSPGEPQPSGSIPPHGQETSPKTGEPGEKANTATALGPTFAEEDAIFELRAIPLYFPASFSLVKPYVQGFDPNGLDAPSLKQVSIDSNWKQ